MGDALNQPGGDDPIVGIDLGTTNSLVAVCDASGPRVLTDPLGRALLPSVVRYQDDGSVVVGHDAKASIAQHPATTIASVKRLMGRSLADAAGDLPFLGYAVEAGERGTCRVRLPLAGGPRLVSPEEVSAEILRALRDNASRALGREVRRAVVTVPAYFDDAQRQATRTAGRLAGLEIVRLVPEPTAAALAYGIGLSGQGERTIVVYDLGGGTFDVSVLRLTPGTADEPFFFQVRGVGGDTHLGGDDIDHSLVDLLAQGLDEPARTPELRSRLLVLAEQTKVRLSDEASVSVPLGAAGTREVTRDTLESLIEPLVTRTIDRTREALAGAGVAGSPIDAVVLVGGSTRIPLVRRRVGELFGLDPYTALDPDRVVALGAAVQGALLSGARRGALLLDVIPLSLGLETVGGAVAKLILKNSTVPAKATEMFSTSVDGQTSIRLSVYQGEREMAQDCRKLGEFHLRGLPPMPAGIPQVEVSFLVDANGVLGVTALERRSGKRARLQVVPNHGLSADEVERIERDSLVHAREDMARHRVVDLIANSTLDLKWIGERLGKHRGALDPDYAAELDRLVASLRGMVEGATRDWRSVPPDAFYAAKEALDRASVRLQEVSIAASLREGR